jgi:penicillin-binding protein A
LLYRPVAPSASLFKVVTAAALLESRRVGLATRQCFFGGEHAIEEEDLLQDYRRDTRCTTFGEALGHSYNLVFAKLALKHLQPAQLRSMAEQVGWAAAPPADVPSAAGIVKIPEDPLGLARAAAGFWNARISPLSAMFLMQTIANRGQRVRLSRLDNGTGEVERVEEGLAMRPATADALTHMLEVTVRRGTSAQVFYDEEEPNGGPLRRVVAGKTGTLIGGHPARMYSWFAGFAPSRKPEIAVAVLLANDVRWWTKGNAVARKFLKAWWEQR